jgi:hypothetical protein
MDMLKNLLAVEMVGGEDLDSGETRSKEKT